MKRGGQRQTARDKQADGQTDRKKSKKTMRTRQDKDILDAQDNTFDGDKPRQEKGKARRQDQMGEKA